MLTKRRIDRLRTDLETLYAEINRPENIVPDPLQFVLAYKSPRDREIAGLLAASLAFGGVKQILASTQGILDVLGSPYEGVQRARRDRIERSLSLWRHRWVTGNDVARLILGIQRVLNEFGSLEACFTRGMGHEDETILPTLTQFVSALRGSDQGQAKDCLLTSPKDGSACKRMNLFLRWMVRRDAVDPGVWIGVPASKLVVPLDVHLHRAAVRMGLTRRKQANLRTALEVTAAFRQIAPDDPVRYDFALTRMGMRRQSH